MITKHITMFDQEYPADVQAEGIAISEAVAYGHCNNCGFFEACSTKDTFKPPVFAWCFKRKIEILKEREANENGN